MQEEGAMKVSVLTPTCNRPVALKLTERMLQRQTRQPDQWVIADGSLERIAFPDPDDRSVVVVRYPQEPGPRNFCTNVMRGLEYVNGDVVVIFEDDDWVPPDAHRTHGGRPRARRGPLGCRRSPAAYLQSDRGRVEGLQEHRLVVGSDGDPACGGSGVAGGREDPVGPGKDRRGPGISGPPPERLKLIKTYDTVVGIRGLPGQRGLGVGHRPTPDWTPDPDWSKLREWIGDDVGIYQQLATRDATAV